MDLILDNILDNISFLSFQVLILRQLVLLERSWCYGNVWSYFSLESSTLGVIHLHIALGIMFFKFLHNAGGWIALHLKELKDLQKDPPMSRRSAFWFLSLLHVFIDVLKKVFDLSIYIIDADNTCSLFCYMCFFFHFLYWVWQHFVFVFCS